MAASVLGLTICAQALSLTPEARADALVNDFVYESLALAPATATFAGYHVHKGVRLDSVWAPRVVVVAQRSRPILQRVLARIRSLFSTPVR